jgi:ribose 5-phosphate isomerase B
MRVAIGSDHAGFQLKRLIADHLRQQGHEVADLGTHEETSTDYPDRAYAVADAIHAGVADVGVLCCGSGQGMAMAANKVAGIRAAVVADPFSARLAKQHNDANVLCLGQRVVGDGLAIECVDSWLSATFEGGRHQRRVDRINQR